MTQRASKGKKPTRIITLGLFSSFVLFLVGMSVLLLHKEQTLCANAISCIQDLSGTKEETWEGIFLNQNITVPQDETPTYALEKTKTVLGQTTGGEKRIYIALGAQRLYAYENNNLVFNFPVSTGKWNHTPTGDFRIWIWLRYTRMAGGSQAAGTYYNLPNVPYTMYFYNNAVPKTAGYGIHGAYWHNNFGHPMSHGCVNMRTEDVEKLFYWANPSATGRHTTYASAENQGPLITIYGETPTE